VRVANREGARLLKVFKEDYDRLVAKFDETDVNEKLQFWLQMPAFNAAAGDSDDAATLWRRRAALLAASSYRRRYGPNEVVAMSGEEAIDVVVLQGGSIRVFKPTDSNSHQKGVSSSVEEGHKLSQGAVIGDIEILFGAFGLAGDDLDNPASETSMHLDPVRIANDYNFGLHSLTYFAGSNGAVAMCIPRNDFARLCYSPEIKSSRYHWLAADSIRDERAWRHTLGAPSMQEAIAYLRTRANQPPAFTRPRVSTSWSPERTRVPSPRARTASKPSTGISPRKHTVTGTSPRNLLIGAPLSTSPHEIARATGGWAAGKPGKAHDRVHRYRNRGPDLSLAPDFSYLPRFRQSADPLSHRNVSDFFQQPLLPRETNFVLAPYGSDSRDIFAMRRNLTRGESDSTRELFQNVAIKPKSRGRVKITAKILASDPSTARNLLSEAASGPDSPQPEDPLGLPAVAGNSPPNSPRRQHGVAVPASDSIVEFDGTVAAPGYTPWGLAFSPWSVAHSKSDASSVAARQTLEPSGQELNIRARSSRSPRLRPAAADVALSPREARAKYLGREEQRKAQRRTTGRLMLPDTSDADFRDYRDRLRLKSFLTPRRGVENPPQPRQHPNRSRVNDLSFAVSPAGQPFTPSGASGARREHTHHKHAPRTNPTQHI